ncbi:BMP family ABC transporter substrate-binding protein [Paraburkholderia sp. D1E]|uniref:BMP family ABC transporter substrate-binding protein n=1 Tax=Paraburkholderia sp. D1E TaxID=3461398 RepID=UPI004045EA5A
MNERRRHVIQLFGAAALSVGMPLAHAAARQRIALAINGNLGDKSFFDLGAAGIRQIQAKNAGSVETKVIEMGVDRTRWEPTVGDLSGQGWDLIIACTYEMGDVIADVAADNPKQTYVLFDGVVPYEKGANRNVASIVYKQNEASYLAGFLAASLLKDGSLAGPGKHSLGFLGGMDIPVINDHLVGYIAGAQAVDSNIRLAISYAGTFNDAAKGKELALAQYRSGVSIGFNCAGQTGFGQLAAAKDAGGYAIGVNSDQEAIFSATDPAIAARIITSVLKRVDVTTVRAFDQFRSKSLHTGAVEAVGLAENAVGLVEGPAFRTVASPALQQRLAQVKSEIVSGKLKVPSAFGMSTQALNTLRASVRA